MKKIIFKWKKILFLLLVMFLFCCSNKQEVSAATKYRVIFANSKGEVSTDIYRNWARSVEHGTRIQLPAFEKRGYRTYWILQDDTSVKRYAPGARVTVNRNMKFCLTHYKLYNAKFYTASGSKELSNLKMKICEGQYFKLPAGPNSSNLKFLGWSADKNGKSFKKAGTSIKVTGNMRFYGVFQKIYTVKLCRNNGSVYKTLAVPCNKTVRFPAICTKTADMGLGWATAKGKTNQPNYYTGDAIPRKSASYYAVIYRKEQDRAPSAISKPTKYDRVYFVGDSRTVDTEKALGSKKPQNVKFIAKGGMGLNWLKSTAAQRLINDVRKQPMKTKKAVIFNFGGNDLLNWKNYLTYMKQLGTVLKSYNCDLYYMSVNPLNSAVNRYVGGTVGRTEKQVADFNNQIHRGLCTGSKKMYTYIDTCHYLKKYGWISDRWNQNIWDGLHYSPNTSLRIYDYCIRFVNR